jgi:hypothetical protein
MTDEERKEIREATILECTSIALNLHRSLEKGHWNWFARRQAEKWGARIAAEIAHLDSDKEPSWRS